MKKIITLYKKEMAYYLNNPVGYVVIALFSVMANFFFMKDLFLRGDSSLRPFFDAVPWLFLVFIPAVGMRLLSEEKRTNTIELLLTLPLSELQIVVSKFLTLVSIVVISLILTLSVPFLISRLGVLATGEVGASYFGLILLGATFGAITMIFSALTKNQVVAFLLSLLTIFIFYIFGTTALTSIVPGFFRETLSFLTPSYQYESFIKGLLDLRSVLYFASLIIAALFFTTLILEKRQ